MTDTAHTDDANDAPDRSDTATDTGRTDSYTAFGTATDLPPVASAVPGDEEPAARCPYCDHPFRDTDLLPLHVGERHADDCTDDERAAYEDAYDRESDDLFVYHLKVIAAIVVLFFGFTYLYAFVLS